MEPRPLAGCCCAAAPRQGVMAIPSALRRFCLLRGCATRGRGAPSRAKQAPAAVSAQAQHPPEDAQPGVEVVKCALIAAMEVVPGVEEVGCGWGGRMRRGGYQRPATPQRSPTNQPSIASSTGACCFPRRSQPAEDLVRLGAAAGREQCTVRSALLRSDKPARPRTGQGLELQRCVCVCPQLSKPQRNKHKIFQTWRRFVLGGVGAGARLGVGRAATGPAAWGCGGVDGLIWRLRGRSACGRPRAGGWQSGAVLGTPTCRPADSRQSCAARTVLRGRCAARGRPRRLCGAALGWRRLSRPPLLAAPPPLLSCGSATGHALCAPGPHTRAAARPSRGSAAVGPSSSMRCWPLTGDASTRCESRRSRWAALTLGTQRQIPPPARAALRGLDGRRLRGGG